DHLQACAVDHAVLYQAVRQARLLIEGVQAEVLTLDCFLLRPLHHAKRSVRFKYSISDLAYEEDFMLSKQHAQLIEVQSILAHMPEIHLAVTDDDGRLPVQEAAGPLQLLRYFFK